MPPPPPPLQFLRPTMWELSIVRLLRGFAAVYPFPPLRSSIQCIKGTREYAIHQHAVSESTKTHYRTYVLIPLSLSVCSIIIIYYTRKHVSHMSAQIEVFIL